MRYFLAGIFLLLLWPVSALAGQPLQVVASFSILGDMAKNVGGDLVSVTTLVGPDQDAHSYQPTPADLKIVAAADLMIVNGLGFENWSKKLIASAQYRKSVVIATEGIKLRSAGEAEDHDHEEHEHGNGHDHHHEGAFDPHAWQNLENAIIYTDNIATALSQALPEQQAVIESNKQKYQTAIRALDKEVRDNIAVIPADQRTIITSHDAFGYFGDAYGIRFLAPYGLNAEAEPSAQAIAQLITQMKAEGVRTVFVENMTNPRLMQQLAKDADAAVGGMLYADALSAPDGEAGDYLKMFKANTQKLVAAMQANKGRS